MGPNEWLHNALYAGGFLVLFALGELLYHVFKTPIEISRKFVHFGTGIITLSFPLVLTSHWSVLILSVSFIGLLIISLKFNLLKSINAIERESLGSILYPVVIYLTYLCYQQFGDVMYFYLPVLVLAISDPMAALCGKKWPYGTYKISKDKKTLVGSSAFFISSFIICFCFAPSLEKGWIQAILIPLSIALISTLFEAISQKGWDNFFIPASVILTLAGWQFLYY